MKNSRKFKIILVDSLWASFMATLVLLVPTIEEMVADFNELILKTNNYNRFYDILLVGLWTAIVLSWGFKTHSIKTPIFKSTSVFFFYFIVVATLFLGIINGFLVSIVLTVVAIAAEIIFYFLSEFIYKSVKLHRK